MRLKKEKLWERTPILHKEPDSTYSISFVSWSPVITEVPGYSTSCIYQNYKVMRHDFECSNQ